jgi:hypothetical protein
VKTFHRFPKLAPNGDKWPITMARFLHAILARIACPNQAMVFSGHCVQCGSALSLMFIEEKSQQVLTMQVIAIAVETPICMKIPQTARLLRRKICIRVLRSWLRSG